MSPNLSFRRTRWKTLSDIPLLRRMRALKPTGDVEMVPKFKKRKRKEKEKRKKETKEIEKEKKEKPVSLGSVWLVIVSSPRMLLRVGGLFICWGPSPETSREIAGHGLHVLQHTPFQCCPLEKQILGKLKCFSTFLYPNWVGQFSGAYPISRRDAWPP